MTHLHLTTQMQAEFETIRKRLDDISKKVWIPLEARWMRHCIIPPADVKIGHLVSVEVEPYKIRLENMLCDTDCKEQGH